MSAKDMCQMKNIYKIIDSGITSLKIEGRMKSEYYIATVVNAYRRAIDSYYKKKKLNKEYVTEILKAANREVSTA
jgi:putative protease